MTYRNGDVIPQVTDAPAWAGLTPGAGCWSSHSADNGAIYGKLYNWYADNDPRGLAPQGWHIPSDAEWTTLSTFLGGGEVAGGKMKTTGTTLWSSPNKNATNESGFSAVPGGYRSGKGVFASFLSNNYLWSATESGYNFSNAWMRFLSSNDGILGRNDVPKNFGYSVRCIKD
jgi:uncharacterized protein (TIGR02145 family)